MTRSTETTGRDREHTAPATQGSPVPQESESGAPRERSPAELLEELRQTRAALEASEARNWAILESAIDYGIITLAPNGTVTSWNAGAAALFGWEAAEIIGRDTRILFTPEDRAAGAPEKEMQTARMEGRSVDERWHVKKDGERFWASGLMRTLKDGSGGYLKIVRDRTDARREEEALRSSKARYRAIVDTAVDAIVTTDALGTIQSFNAAAEQIFGHTAQDVVGCNINILVAQEHQPQEDGGRGEPPHAGGRSTGFTGEAKARRKDGSTFPVDVSIAAWETEGQIRHTVIFRDISERRRVEERLRLVGEESRHRVKNILSTVQSIAYLTFRDATDQEAAFRAFSGRLGALALTQEVLAGDLAGADLAAIAAAELAPYPETAVHFEGPDVTLAPHAAQTMALILHELATNAAKYGALSQPGGRVALTWSVDSGQVRLEWTESGGPSVTSLDRRGFGRLLIERIAARDLQGDAQMEFRPEGLHYVLRFPLASLSMAR
jgi:PAS domain S-box-containing protein